MAEPKAVKDARALLAQHEAMIASKAEAEAQREAELAEAKRIVEAADNQNRITKRADAAVDELIRKTSEIGWTDSDAQSIERFLMAQFRQDQLQTLYAQARRTSIDGMTAEHLQKLIDAAEADETTPTSGFFTPADIYLALAKRVSAAIGTED